MRRCWPLLGAIAMNVAGCGDDDRPPTIDPNDRGSRVPAERLPATADAFTASDCWFDAPFGVTVQCGRVTVPEDPAEPAGPELTLAVARFFSGEETVADDPVVYLEGGPGGDALATVSSAFDVFAHLLNERDLVVFDQRGTGHSQPRLDCPELDSATVTVGTSETDAALDALSACRNRLVAEGVDLDAYTSARNAADVDAIRKAFGYERWNLYGISYGTRLALTVLRDYPDGVRSAILDGVLPVELEVFVTAGASAQRSFELVFELCASQAACAQAYPDPMQRLATTVAAMDADPVDLSLPDGSTLSVTGAMVLNVLFLVLYDAESIPYLPALIDLIAAGDLSLFELLVTDTGDESGVALGMYLSVVCGEDAPFSSPAAVTAAASGLLPLFEPFADGMIFDECLRWDVTAALALEDEPVVSAVPTLLTSGTFDPVTPPENGDRVASSLLAAEHVVLPYESHGASTCACGSALVDRFLAAPGEPVDHPCVESLRPRSFEVTRRRHAAPSPHLHTGPLDPATLEQLAERARQRLRTPRGGVSGRVR